MPIANRPFSAAVLADGGYDVVHVTYQRPLPLDAGLKAALAMTREAGRPALAIAGFELRIPQPMTPTAFDAFNDAYAASLNLLGFQVNGDMPAGRTNVAALAGAVTEPSVYAMSYTAQSTRDSPAFLISGVAESQPGDVEARLNSIVDAITTRLGEIGASWDAVTTIQLYGGDEIESRTVEMVLRRAGLAALHGVHWFPAVPPTDAFTLEIDVRSSGVERILA